MADQIPARSRALVLARAGGRCEVCGIDAPLELHHRRYRSRGGHHRPSNLVAVCGWGNHSGCHGWAHTAALAGVWGVSLHSWQEPNEERLWSEPRASWVMLDDDGNARDIA